MRLSIFCFFILSFNTVFSQKKVSKIFELTSKEIVINSIGLDNLKLENSENNFVEVTLLAESYNDQLVIVNENEQEALIKFHFEGTETREVIFRKFITKRLQRAEAIVKIPKNVKVIIAGQNVDIQSKNILNELEVLIENGIVTLNNLKKDTSVKLYAGNVYANYKDFNLNVKSSLGKIQVDEKLFSKKYIINKKSNSKTLLIETIKGNVFTTSI